MNKPITTKEMEDWIKTEWKNEADRKELDTLWQQALIESVNDGEQFARYHFAALVVAAEREACARLCADYTAWGREWGQDNNHMAAEAATNECAAAIRARGEK